MPAIRVLIVEDHRMFAEAVAQSLEAFPEFTVVGMATTAEEGRRMLAERGADVVLMDYRLPDGTGTHTAQLMSTDHPATKVVIVTATDDDILLAEAIDAGCSGFVVKTRGLRELVTATRAAAAGDAVIPPPLLRHMVSRISGAAAHAPFGLTAREIEVLRLLSGGTATRDIAARLGISVHTVRNHVQNIIRKCDAHSKLEAVSTALREGVIRTPTRSPSQVPGKG